MPRAIIIEGLIGAGKSEFLQLVTEALAPRGRVAVVSEPVAEWRRSGALKRFYEDPPRRAYEFQTYVFATRVLALHAACDDAPDFLAMERSPATDRVFMGLQQVSAEERAMYDVWCDAYTRLLPVDLSAAVAFHLDPPLATCMRRLAERGRAEEAAVGEEYQSALATAHVRFLYGEPPEARAGECGVFHAPIARAPYSRVIPVPPEIAESDFRRGPDRDAAVRWIGSALDDAMFHV